MLAAVDDRPRRPRSARGHRDRDYALDVTLRGVAGIAEDDHIAALYWLEAVDELVDENPFLILQRGHHAGAFNFDGLVKKDDEEGRDRQRNQDVAHPA